MQTPQIIQLPKFLDERGNLSFFENHNQLPFSIQRVHWIYDVPGGEERGGLAYKTTEEFIVAMSGSFDVLVDDGMRQYHFSLNRSYMGVYVPAGTWRTITNYYANAGIYMLRREVVNMIPKDEFYNATDLIDALVKNGSKVIRYPLKGTWIDIGTLSEYQKAKDIAKHMK